MSSNFSDQWRKRREKLFEEEVCELGTSVEFADVGDLSRRRRWKLFNHEEAIFVGYL